jgi:uncharacterized protein YbgA (DUF1722 family)/uncharacterized protein YbbK (DUF523 family)
MHAQDPSVRIGISSCLLGERVRFDGSHKLDRFLSETLGKFFEWVPVCPEVEAGFGTPREPMHLEQIGAEVRMITVGTRADLTPAMNKYASARVEALAKDNLSGYIFKKNSPSCGLLNVRFHAAVTRRREVRGEKAGMLPRRGRGLFAEAMRARFPFLPMEEEGRLCDPGTRENWIQRVFSYCRLSRLWNSRWTVGSLQKFHARHRLTLLSHSPRAASALGRFVAEAHGIPRQELKAQYESEFMRILAVMATRGKNADVLQHAAGCFKRIIDSGSRRELSNCIADYRRGIVPLVVPVTLIRHYLRQYEIPYLSEQVYLNPYPKELALQNHV